MMHRTYEVYLRRNGERAGFRAVVCHEHEILRHARELMEAEDLDEVEVQEGGQTLLTLVK
jgi:hypothetical protein